MVKSIFKYETLVYATAGAAGSVISLACLYPLDIVKFRKQMEDKAVIDKSSMGALIYLLKKEGLESLYRGLQPDVTTTGISNFIYFYAFHGFRTLLPQNMKSLSETDLLLSIAAGIVNAILTCPLQVTNSRLKMSDNPNYKGLLDGVLYIGRNEGMYSLWKGLVPSLILVSNPAIHFTLYETLKRKVTVKSVLTYFMLGAVSKAMATILTYPLQLAQTRQRLMQNKKISTPLLLWAILKQKGPTGLFQGLWSKLLQTVLSSALMFMTYEKIAQSVFILMLRKQKRKALT